MTLLYLSLAWGVGILVGAMLWTTGAIGCATPQWAWAIPALAVTPLLIMRRPQRSHRLIAALLLCAVAGGWRFHSHPLANCRTTNDLSFYHADQEPVWARVEGIVVGYPEYGDTRIDYRLRAERLTLSDGKEYPVKGDLLVVTGGGVRLSYGDRVESEGVLADPPVYTDFDYRAYLAIKGVRSVMQRGRVKRISGGHASTALSWLYSVRARASRLLNQSLPEPEASVANGMLLGLEGGIPPEVDDSFRRTGASHVIVISGTNIALVSTILLGVFSRRLGKRRAVWPTAFAIAAYVMLVGADPASMRAGGMGLLYVIAIALGRQSTALVSLGASALLMTAFNPLCLWDVGFQLSCVATAGLILLSPPLQAKVNDFLDRKVGSGAGRTVLDYVGQVAVPTLAAQAATIPLTFYHFGNLSPISLATNLLIAPAQPLIMLVGMVTMFLGLFWQPIATLMMPILWLPLAFTIGVVELTAEFPFASVALPDWAALLIPLYYVLLFGWGAQRPESPLAARQRLIRRVSLACAVALILVWSGSRLYSSQSDGRLHVVFPPDPANEAVLLVTPSGKGLWIDDGEEEALQIANIPPLRGWRGEPDLIVGIPPHGVWDEAESINPYDLAPGTIIRTSDDVSIRKMASGPDEWVLEVRFGGFCTVTPTALVPETQSALLASGDDACALTMIKAPGRSSGRWPTTPFLTELRPQVVYWPLDTTYPPETSAWLEDSGATRFDSSGWLEIVTDGVTFRSRAWSSSGTR